MFSQDVSNDRPVRRTQKRYRDGGFVMITFALLLIPVVTFTALAVDVSSWYSRATELQRSADAAALAGVVWMPDLNRSKTAATPVLAKNGFQNGVDDISVTMDPGATGATSFRVCITDNKVAQFFGVVFASPTKMTRCATAQYNAPLQLGSPLNYFGGNHDTLFESQPGPVPPDAIGYAPDASAFNPGDRRCWVRDSYPTGTVTGYWDNRGYSNKANWYFWPTPPNTLGGSHPNCNTTAPAVPDEPSGSGCNADGNGNFYWYDNGGSGAYPANWRYRERSYNTGRDCIYNGVTVNPIPSSKSPNFWPAVESYNYGHANGDAYSNAGAEWRGTGYWYSIDIPPGLSGNVSVQAFDLTYNKQIIGAQSRSPTGDNSGGSTGTPVKMAVYKAGTMKYDMSAISPIAGCDTGWLTGNDANPAYDLTWKQVCSLTTPAAGDRYYINILSNDGTNGMSGQGVTGYALRAVAGSDVTACTGTRMKDGDVACYEGSPKTIQPRLSAYGDMEMFNGISSGTPTQFYLADVVPTYAGKTLVIDLFDPGDGAGSSWVTVRGPSTTSTGGTMVPSSACSVQYREYGSDTWHNGSLSSGPGGAYPNTCTVQTTSSSSNFFQDRWLRFKIDLPTDYGPSGSANWTNCDTTVTDPVNNAGSCWWQISYYVGSGTLGDYTTWSARVIGDPVRLTM